MGARLSIGEDRIAGGSAAKSRPERLFENIVRFDPDCHRSGGPVYNYLTQSLKQRCRNTTTKMPGSQLTINAM